MHFVMESSPDDKCHLLVRKLVDVHVRDRIRLVETTCEVMWKFVELAKFPLRERGISAATHVRGVLVVLL